jgi:ribonuclease HII
METLLLQNPLPKAKLLKNQYEKEAWNSAHLVCGVDEVGRGCLAGPLVTAAVILHPNRQSRLLKDSKILTKEELLKGQAWVVKNSWYGYGIVSNYQIDAHNIYQATLIAMKRAVMQAFSVCPYRPSAVLVDAMPLKLNFSTYQDVQIHSFPKGESLSISIAAASIIAKVKRDELISRFDRVVPGYQFAEHKGYATDIHCNAVRHEGRSLIHRTSFLSRVLNPEKDDHGEQSTLF